jgi:hypothetical protein
MQTPGSGRVRREPRGVGSGCPLQQTQAHALPPLENNVVLVKPVLVAGESVVARELCGVVWCGVV